MEAYITIEYKCNLYRLWLDPQIYAYRIQQDLCTAAILQIYLR